MIQQKAMYILKGHYVEKGTNEIVEDTSFFYIGADSMIDHQKMWQEEAIKLNYRGGELNVTRTILANYHSPLTHKQLDNIIHNSDLMDTPFNELFSSAIDAYLLQNE